MIEVQAVTELEQCVLGIVWQSGPITAYEIAKPFAQSPSTYWSGSAGAIYPLVKRLEEKGLLQGETAKWNSRQKRTFTITPEGLRELREWLAPPFTPDVGAVSFDPVRTRMSFLGALPQRQRERFVDEAERVIKEHLEELRKIHAAELAKGNVFEALAGRGGIHELEARLKWLAEVRRELVK